MIIEYNDKDKDIEVENNSLKGILLAL